MNRRKFFYVVFGGIIIILGGVAAYFAAKSSKIFEKVVEKTIVRTVKETVHLPPKTLTEKVEIPVEKTITTTVEKPIEKTLSITIEKPKTIVSTLTGKPKTIHKTKTLTELKTKTVTETKTVPTTVKETLMPKTKTTTITEKVTITKEVTKTTTIIPKSKVAIVKGDDLEKMTRDAIEMVGGMDSIVSLGDTVIVKPNWVVSSRPPTEPPIEETGTITKIPIVLTVVEECLKAGASKVVIAEGGQQRSVMYEKERGEELGLDVESKVANLNKKYGEKVYLVSLNSQTPYYYMFPSDTSFGEVAIPSLVAEADTIISIPVLKTHHTTATTLSLKNLFGMAPFELYGAPRIKCHLVERGVEQFFLDMVKAMKPKLAIVDGSIGVEGEGPAAGIHGEGITVNVKKRIGGYLIIAGKDLVATDSIATRVIGHDPYKIRYLNMAASQGMGKIDLEEIEVVGERLEDVQMSWIPSKQSGYPQEEV
jgi:uncharacterized protein (DUF362 family)